MQNRKSFESPVYTVWLPEQTFTGTAEEILDQIRTSARTETVRDLSTDQYAQVLIEDADFFIPREAWKFLQKQTYESDFDRALQYLAAMPTSGVRILARKATA